MNRTCAVVFLYADKDRMNKLSDFFVFAEQRGVSCFIAPLSSFEASTLSFARANRYDQGEWITEASVRPDIIFDKTSGSLSADAAGIRKVISDTFPFINRLELNELCTNKWETYVRFASISPKSILISTEEDLESLREIDSDLVVAKPLRGFGGTGIRITKKGAFQFENEPVIVQEFIETTNGIPGITTERHDLRILMQNDVPFHSILRTPKEGSLLSNYSQGGSIRVIPITELPDTVIKMVHLISKELSKFFPALYSIDIMFDKSGKAMLTELNSKPGLSLAPAELSSREPYYERIIGFLKNAVCA